MVLAELAGRLETMARNNEPGGVATLVDQVFLEQRRVVAALIEAMPSAAA